MPDDLPPTTPRVSSDPLPVDPQTTLHPRPLDDGTITHFEPSDGPSVAHADDLLTNPSSNVRPSPRVVLPGYEVIGELGVGGMGVVYHARDLRLGRDVAVKMVLGDRTNPQGLIRFQVEAQAVAAVRHHYVVQVYDSGEQDGRPYLILEYCPGGSLAGRLVGCTKFPPHQAADLLRRIAEGVAAVHAVGIVHRDLKPANILFGPTEPGAEPKPKVADFGLARRGTGAGLTQSLALMGTPQYMSPEQAEQRPRFVGPPADVWALGVILYECLTGTRPFHADSAEAVLSRVLTDRPAPLRAQVTDLPRDLDVIVGKCLEKDPADRFPTAAELAADLGRFVRGELIAARPAGRVERVAKWVRRKPTTATAWGFSVLAVALALVVGIVTSFWREAETARAGAVDARDRLDNALGTETRLRGELEVALQNESSIRVERDRVRTSKASEAVVALLDQTRTALDGGDADRAASFLEQATRRADDDSMNDHAARLAAYRTDLAMLRELDRVDNFRWTPIESIFPNTTEVVEQGTTVFARYGIVLGMTPPTDAAAQINGSTIRLSLVSALDGWLAIAHRPQTESIGTILEAADPDPFRTEVRRALARKSLSELTSLTSRPEWAAQPSGVIQAFAGSPRIRTQDSRTLLARVSVERPTDFGLLLTLGRSYGRDLDDGNDERVRWFQSAVAVRPQNAAARAHLALALGQRKEWNTSIAINREAIRLDPTCYMAYHNLGNALLETGDNDGAVAAFRDAVKHNPKNPQHHSNLANALSARKDFVTAEVACREALRINPRYAPAHSNLGNALAGLGKRDEAIAEFYEAIRLDSKLAQPHNGLGKALRAKGQTDAAIASYREALRLAPSSAYSHNGLGLALLDKQAFAAASTEFREAMRLDPKSGLYPNNLGLALRAVGDVDGAITSFREAIRLDPSLPTPYSELGKTLHGRKDLDGAIAAFREAIRLDAKAAFRYQYLGQSLLNKNDLDGAATVLREAIRLDPTHAPSHYTLGNVLRRKGDTDGGIRCYQEAIRFDPQHAEAHCNLGRELQRSGQLVDGAWHLRRGHEWGSRRPSWNYPSGRWVEECERELSSRGLVAPPPRVVTR